MLSTRTPWIAASVLLLIPCGPSLAGAGDWPAPPGGSSWSLPDLQAVSIEYWLVKAYDSFGTKGRVRIRGIVTNCKGGVFVGNAHATLWEESGGRWQLVTSKKIPPLPTGAVVEVVHELDWDKFAPPTTAYRLVVELDWADQIAAADPPSNNVLIRSSEGLSALLHPTMKITNSSPFRPVLPIHWPQPRNPREELRRR